MSGEAARAWRATHMLVDGYSALRVDIPYEFSLEEAALALALVHRDEPLRTGIHVLIDGLKTAARQRLLDLPYEVPQRAVTAYRNRLTTEPQVMFPQGRTRTRMLKELGDAKALSRKTGNQEAALKVSGKQTRVWSKHERPDGTPVSRVEVAHYFRLEEAATALAVVYAGKATPVSSIDGFRDGLQTAARDGVVETLRAGLPVDADPATVASYQLLLVGKGVFSKRDLASRRNRTVRGGTDPESGDTPAGQADLVVGVAASGDGRVPDVAGRDDDRAPQGVEAGTP